MSTHPGSESERPAAGLLEQREAGGQRCSLLSPFIQPQRQAFPQVHNHGPLPFTTSLRCYSQQQTARLLFFLPFLPLFSFSALFSAPELLLCLSGRMCVPHQKSNFTNALYCQGWYLASRRAGSGSQDARSGPKLLNLITHLSPSSHGSAQLSPFLFNGQPGSLLKQTFKWLGEKKEKRKKMKKDMKACEQKKKKKKSLCEFMPLQIFPQAKKTSEKKKSYKLFKKKKKYRERERAREEKKLTSYFVCVSGMCLCVGSKLPAGCPKPSSLKSLGYNKAKWARGAKETKREWEREKKAGEKKTQQHPQGEGKISKVWHVVT